MLLGFYNQKDLRIFCKRALKQVSQIFFEILSGLYKKLYIKYTQFVVYSVFLYYRHF